MLSGPTEFPNVINATVTVIVKVIERNFTADMKNMSSQDYKNFTDLFLSQVGASPQPSVVNGYLSQCFIHFLPPRILSLLRAPSLDPFSTQPPSQLPVFFFLLPRGSTNTSLELSRDRTYSSPV